jgi:3-hydroxyisobutyrate dehydrogenase
MTSSGETVAVLGAGGTMGLPIARNLARAGFDVRAWNRTRQRAEPLSADGATVCDSPADAVRDAAILLTMLSDADAVLDVVSGGDGALPAGVELWLQMSTIGLAGTDRCAELAAEHGIGFVDAPVLGTKQPAEQGELLVLGSGPGESRERLAPLFDPIAKRVIWAGDAGAGTRLKLVVNAWLVSLVEGAAEAIALAQGIGTDPELFLDAVSGGALDVPYLQSKGRAMVEREFAPAFRLALAAKDARLVEEAAERHGLDLPLLSAVAARLAEGAEQHPDEDMAATFLTSAPAARSH